jgi:hypothetical protein
MGTTRFFTGTATDGTRYDFVEEIPDCAQGATQVTPSYRLSRDGSYLKKVNDNEFTIVRSGVKIRVQ